MEISMDSDYNHEESYNVFMGLVEMHYSEFIYKAKDESIHLKSELDETIRILKTLGLKDRSKRTKLLMEYELRKEKGEYILIVKKGITAYNLFIEVLPFERIFDVLMELHIVNKHSETKALLQEATQYRYKIPSQCFDLIRESCNVCRQASTASQWTGNTTRNGRVLFLRNMRLHKDVSYFTSILIYLDDDTEFTVLRPLHALEPLEIAMEVFKIFMQFGPAQNVCLQSPNFTDTVFVVKNIMKELCPTCEVTYTAANDQEITTFVMNAIAQWMQETKCTLWEIGCPVVQNRLNTTRKPHTTAGSERLGVTAHDLFFKDPLIYEYNPNRKTRNKDSDDVKVKDSDDVKDKQPFYGKYEPLIGVDECPTNSTDVLRLNNAPKWPDDEPLVYATAGTNEEDPLAAIKNVSDDDVEIIGVEKLNLSDKRVINKIKKPNILGKGKSSTKSNAHINESVVKKNIPTTMYTKNKQKLSGKNKGTNIEIARKKKFEHLFNLKDKASSPETSKNSVEKINIVSKDNKTMTEKDKTVTEQNKTGEGKVVIESDDDDGVDFGAEI